MTNYIGIDYGKYAGSNRDKDTGIHYGVISCHSLGDWIDDVISEGADFGQPTCPKCGNAAIDNNDANDALVEHSEDCESTDEDCDCMDFPRYQDHGCADYLCLDCRHTLDSSEVFSEEMLGWSHDEDGYQLTDCLDNDVFVIKSPYYTYAQFCSPCVPGAGNLDHPIELTGLPCIDSDGYEVDAPKVYCMGHEWFESNKAPYRVFNVTDDSEVMPDKG